MSFYRIEEKASFLNFKIRPNAQETKIKEIEETFILMDVRAVPEDGKANKDIIEYLASLFDINKSQVKIIRGETTRYKIVELKAALSAEIIKFKVLSAI